MTFVDERFSQNRSSYHLCTYLVAEVHNLFDFQYCLKAIDQFNEQEVDSRIISNEVMKHI